MLDPNVRISIDEALTRVLDRVGALPEQRVELIDALGRVLSHDVVSDIDVTPFDNSSMDGYAVRSCDLEGASEASCVEMDVVGYIGAGSAFDGVLKPGQTVRLMTGAPMPQGADAVQKFELVNVVSGQGETGSRVSFSAPVKPGNFVRLAGEEFKAGEVALPAGTFVNAYALGMLASAGAREVDVYRRPVVGIFTIGSELMSMATAPADLERGKIRDSNSWTLAGLVHEAGGEPRLFGIVPDDREAIKAVLDEALACCDMVISAGGASQGDFDFIQEVISTQGQAVFSYLSLRPGKRQTFGIVEGKPVFGLSGNPAAASVGFELLIRPALRKMQGYSNLQRPLVKARLARDAKKGDTRRIYLRATITKDADGAYTVEPAKNQSSGLFGVIQRSNCLAVLPEGGEGRTAGSMVECILLDVNEDVCL